MDFSVDMKEEGDAKQTCVAVYLNKALCQQKLNDLDEVKHCVSVLKFP